MKMRSGEGDSVPKCPPKGMKMKGQEQEAVHSPDGIWVGLLWGHQRRFSAHGRSQVYPLQVARPEQEEIPSALHIWGTGVPGS